MPLKTMIRTRRTSHQVLRRKVSKQIAVIYLSPFHNYSALLHALILLTAYMGQGKFIHKIGH